MTSQAYNNNVLLFLPQIWKAGMLMFFWLGFLPFILVEKRLLNSELWKQQYWGDMKNNIYEELS